MKFKNATDMYLVAGYFYKNLKSVCKTFSGIKYQDFKKMCQAVACYRKPFPQKTIRHSSENRKCHNEQKYLDQLFSMIFLYKKYFLLSSISLQRILKTL